MAISNSLFADKKKVYRFPENLVDSAVDEAGKPVQYMIFEISSSTSGTMMAGDAPVSTEQVTSIEESRLSFSSDLKNVRKWSITNTLSVIDTAIALPMPNDHVVATAVEYDTKFTPSDLQKVGDIMTSNASWSSRLVDSALSIAVEKIKDKGGDTKKVFDYAMASQGRAVNPRHEVMFTGIDFRSFSFSYSFAPRSARDSIALRNIINTFRYYALPEMASTKLYFTFPGVFRVKFMLGENPNIWVPKIATCVLRRVNVNYSPNGSSWATLPMGEPLQINLTLDFTEIELIDRLKIDNTNVPGANTNDMGY